MLKSISLKLSDFCKPMNAKGFRRFTVWIALTFFMFSCSDPATLFKSNKTAQPTEEAEFKEEPLAQFINLVLGRRPAREIVSVAERVSISSLVKGFRETISQTELNMIEHGLVDIQQLDPSIVVEMKYATTDNFLGKDVYEGMTTAYLQPDVAEMLVRSQHYLQRIRPGYSLIVYDAARPRSVQQRMWDAIDAPFSEKIKFLSNPRNGSIHNFGAAVDVSILNEKGEVLDMGTDFDFMGELAYPRLEQELLEQGLLKPEQVENRKLLRGVMRYGGFWGIQTEWWHFNAFTRAEARERYQIIE